MGQVAIHDQAAPELAHSMWTARRQTLQAMWRYALLPYLGTRFIVLMVAWLADSYILGTLKPYPGKPKLFDETNFPGFIWKNWTHFDSGFYIHISIAGYPTTPPHSPYSIWEFYPLFPMLMHPFGVLFGGSVRDYALGGLLVSNLAALVAIGYLFLLVRRDFGQRIASLTVILQGLFPGSFFLSAVYSESTFFAPAVACLYYARGRNWLGAGIAGALATLARGPGVLLIIPVLWELWQATADSYAPLVQPVGAIRQEWLHTWWASRARGTRLAVGDLRTWLNLLAVALIPLGQVAFMVYAKIHSGSFMSNLTAIRKWNHSLTWPWTPIIHDLIQHPSFPPSVHTYAPFPLSATLIVAFGICTVWSFMRLPAAYSLYALVMFLIPLTSGYVSSIPRYYLVLFPAYILLAQQADPTDHPMWFALLIALFTALLAMLTTFFQLGFPIAGV